MVSHETVTLLRDCDATIVPAGTKVVIPEGTEVTITQTLGGSYSVITDRGFMARVEAIDADALGKEPVEEAPKTAPIEKVSDPETMETLVWDQLRSVYDPEIPVNIVDLGLVYKCDVAQANDGYRVEVEMTMTAPGCGMGDVLRDDAIGKIRSLPGLDDVSVEIVWEPVWNQSLMSDAARLQLGMD